MQFTDAVAVSGNPPVTDEHLRACKRLLAEFAHREDVPMPLFADWTDHGDVIGFTCTHEGRTFAIGAPKAQ